MHHSVEEHLVQYKEGMGNFEATMPDLTKAYNHFTELCFQEGQVSQKHKQLAALTISVYAQDEYCIIYHTKGSLNEGATEEEISEIIGVSTAIGGGAAMSQGATLVQECMQTFRQH